jgi:hypothetical protein
MPWTLRMLELQLLWQGGLSQDMIMEFMEDGDSNGSSSEVCHEADLVVYLQDGIESEDRRRF